MKVDCEVISHVHLDPGYALLSAQNTFTSMQMFAILDVDGSKRLNDVQFLLLMKNITNLSNYQVEIIFNLLDIDHSGEIEFDEFYLIYCILIANKDAYEKEFIYRHSKSIFQLIDSDGSGEVNSDEFGHMGILFNFDMPAIHRIFVEFDVSGDKSLDFTEFRLFTMACIDEARAQAARRKVKAYDAYHTRLLKALEPVLRRFIRTDCLPLPREIESTTNKVRLPFSKGKHDWAMPFTSQLMIVKFTERREIFRTYVQNLVGEKLCLFKFFRCLCCDFCCLGHKEDELTCDLKIPCVCHCCACMRFMFRRLLGCCHCCCPCCPCWAEAHHNRTMGSSPKEEIVTGSWEGHSREHTSNKKHQRRKIRKKQEQYTKKREKSAKRKLQDVLARQSCGIM